MLDEVVAHQLKVMPWKIELLLQRARRRTGAPTTTNLVYRLMRKGLIR